jgi:hypothetical protein
LFVIPQRLFCLSFRSEAEESAFARCATVYTITENGLDAAPPLWALRKYF